MKVNAIVGSFAALVCTASFTECTPHKTGEEQAYAIRLYDDNPYLAEVWWGDDYDENTAKQLITKQLAQSADKDSTNTSATEQKTDGGGCSSWHHGNFHGRNIDWGMKDFASIIIHMPRNEAKGIKYASVSIVTGSPKLTKDFIHNNKEIPEKFRSLVPASAVDGMNECGVAINHNIVPYDGKPFQEDGDLPSIMVTRFVLDHFATAREAVDSLSKMKIAQALPKKYGDYSHFMISDPTCTYVVEWIDGRFTATEFKDDGNGNFVSKNGLPAVMTNYFVGVAEKYGFMTKEFFKNHPTAEGVERTEIITKQLPMAKTVDDNMSICRSVWYRQFCQGKTKWYSEQCGNVSIDSKTGKACWWYPTKKDFHMMDNDDIYAAEKAALESPEFQQYYKDFNEKWDKCDPDNPYWYTQHSVVYDLKNRKGYLIMQEGIFSDMVIEIGI